jgi:heat-inducible transcriptional repressor
MAELEALGYLEQPHTSAGRIPSELGYRYYVNSLLGEYTATSAEIEDLSITLKSKMKELDNLLAEASRIAASVTNYTSFALKPKNSTVKVSRFECVYLDPRTFVLVMMLENQTVKTKTIHLAFNIDKETLERLSFLLNRSFVEVSADDILLSEIMKLEREMGMASAIVTPIVKAIHETLKELDGGDIRMEGVNHLLQYPEYTDLEELRSLIGVIEDKEQSLNLIPIDKSSADDINVFIGSENSVRVMNNSTLVFKSIKQGERVIGAIGVIGPRRMNYSKVISTIDRLASGIDNLLNEENKDND